MSTALAYTALRTLCVVAALLLAACGGGEPEDDDPKTPAPPNCTLNPELCK